MIVGDILVHDYCVLHLISYLPYFMRIRFLQSTDNYAFKVDIIDG